MEITITPSFILQILSLVFTAGTIYAWVKFNIKSCLELLSQQAIIIKNLEEQCSTIEHLHISRKDAFDAFVTKEIIEVHLQNLGKDMAEIKSIVAQLHAKRATD